jgi:1-acyl-sn-glycerol-3-phosphate acyltransferase
MIRSLAASVKALGFLALTLPLMPIQAVLLRFKHPTARALPYLYHRMVCRILRVELQTEGNVPTAGLIVANHVSWLDIPVLSAAAKVSFVAKKDVAGWPFFGTLARLQNTVFVDRERKHSTGKSRNEMLHRLKAGETLVLFPEGTSNNGRHLKPFKSTFFAAVEGAQLPIVPVTLVYQSQRGLPLTLRQWPGIAWYGDMRLLPHLWAALKGGSVKVRVIFHPALFLSEPGHRKALAAAAEMQIRQALAENLHQNSKMG